MMMDEKKRGEGEGDRDLPSSGVGGVGNKPIMDPRDRGQFGL
jgi:hypothetical protein